MTTPRNAQHRDLQQTLKDLQSQIQELRNTVLRRQRLNVTEGDFVVSGGGNVEVRDGGALTVRDGGGMILESEEGTPVVEVASHGGEYSRPDGARQPIFVLRRDDGSHALALWDPAPEWDGYRQILALYDRAGQQIMAEDANSGHGLAAPLIPLPLYRADVAGSFTTSSGSWETAWWGHAQLFNPKMHVQVVAFSGNGNVGEVRVKVAGRVVGEAQQFGESAYLSWRHLDVPEFSTGDWYLYEVQLRHVSGPDTVAVSPVHCMGADSA